MIKRHSKLSIFLHWFNAACWLFLLATGIGLIKNPDLQPVGMWWTNMMWGIFGGGPNLLLAHEICGSVWAGVFILYGIFGIKQVIRFFREIFSYAPVRDFMWLVKKGVQMTLGPRALESLGAILEKRGAKPHVSEPKVPDQGFYNVGQKLFAVPSVMGYIYGIDRLRGKACIFVHVYREGSGTIRQTSSPVVVRGGQGARALKNESAKQMTGKYRISNKKFRRSKY
jgi:formate dehydrogenase subunit gamma